MVPTQDILPVLPPTPSTAQRADEANTLAGMNAAQPSDGIGPAAKRDFMVTTSLKLYVASKSKQKKKFGSR
ncbi:hypothetical protein PGTUg99_035995 [Puccinia graminis f. sp. tritici]|uniref:Uncharacterized protein n=1 Tax=Puccinia graminis f. sp. tritici TaxID=56615 RepID=A0A5B0RQN4_PUCGR|nr:hypothetical protein PGTUg99_035995 [Puccinia graminis f. sp. tritici]